MKSKEIALTKKGSCHLEEICRLFTFNDRILSCIVTAMCHCGKDCRGAVGCHWTERVYE